MRKRPWIDEDSVDMTSIEGVENSSLQQKSKELWEVEKKSEHGEVRQLFVVTSYFENVFVQEFH